MNPFVRLGKFNAKLCKVYCTARCNRTSLKLNDLLCDRQPQTRAAALRTARCIQSEKLLKYTFQLCGRYLVTMIDKRCGASIPVIK